MIGKIMPYIVVGYVQVTLILLAAQFHLQRADGRQASSLLYGRRRCCSSRANLAMGITFSTARAQPARRPCRWRSFSFCRRLLLSGFMFPFRGMPEWAQRVGELPAADAFSTDRARHSAQGQRARGNRAGRLAARVVFLVVAMTVGVKRYRQTLD
jgi:ABC-2 type transport system permease protein